MDLQSFHGHVVETAPPPRRCLKMASCEAGNKIANKSKPGKRDDLTLALKYEVLKTVEREKLE